MHLVLQERQDLTLAYAAPEWLLRLVALVHRTRMSVVSFNYDLLLEAAVNSAELWDWGNNSFARSWNATGDLPPELPRSGWFGRSHAQTFRLLKLHGSLNCWWVDGDVTGATIVRDHNDVTFGPYQDEPKRQGPPPGRTPFLVPPASAKSRFYGNPISRELWRRAAAELGEASEVDLIGYSLPRTDLVTNGMFADRLGGRDVKVMVINPSPEAPASALRSVGVPVAGFTSTVPEYVDLLENQVAATATSELDDLSGELPLLIGTSDNILAAVIHDGGTAGFRVELLPATVEPTRSRLEELGPTLATVADVRRVHPRGTPLRMSAGNDRLTVIGWEQTYRQTGHADTWAVGVTSRSVRGLDA